MSKPKAARRKLHFNSLDELLADAKTLAASGAMASGGWSTGQIVGHVTGVIEASVEGFPFSLPLPMRLFGRLMRKRMLVNGLPPGFKVPDKASKAFIPSPDLTFNDAVAGLADVVKKAKQHRMTIASPIFGKLTHEQWVQLHCRHAELHFSFINPISQHDEQNQNQNQNQSNTSNVRHASATA